MPRQEVQRVLPHTAERLFDIAADVERYPEFLPWWVAARVRHRQGDVYQTDQVVSLGVLRRRFSSETVLRRPERIEVTSTDRLFRRFELVWAFDAAADEGCLVSLAVDLELRSRVMDALLGQTLAGTVDGIVSAFEARARRFSDSPAPARAQPRGAAPVEKD
jgi:coenzyme Q-binding protein COQ10